MIMLQPYLYEVIRNLVDSRVKDKVFPYIATENKIYEQIRRDISETINEMEADGLICHSENINGIRMFRPIENETDHVQ